MIFRQISKALIPNLERDLSKSLKTELATAAKMTDCMIAPTVYGYEASAVGGVFGKTAARQSRMVKVQYPAPQKGFFE